MSVARTHLGLRWMARILSLAWAYWSTLMGSFLLAHWLPGDLEPGTWLPTLLFLSVGALCLTPAVLASVWGRERLGGTWLLVDAGLLFVGGLLGLGSILAQSAQASELAQGITGGLMLGLAGFVTMVLPAILAGRWFRSLAA